MTRLTDRWKPLRHHPIQRSFFEDEETRYFCVSAGRRSGKTELAKRKLVKRAMASRSKDARYFAAAPTRDQARQIFWEDLKALIPRWAIAAISESNLTIQMKHGPRIIVVGLDKPQRIEGRPWDGGVIDEIADCRPDAWPVNIRPALMDRQGFCWFTGVPEGRNHFWELCKRGQAGEPGWRWLTWPSSDILPLDEVEAARGDMDPDIFRQEMEGSFVAFKGRVYKYFDRSRHAVHDLSRLYRPDQPLIVMLDFNVSPGVAVVAQDGLRLPTGDLGTGILGEVYIERDSDTRAVCRRLVREWMGHQGPLLLYGDATGGSRSTSQSIGTDWDIAEEELRGHFPGGVQPIVPRSNPPLRVRVNAVNARLQNARGEQRLAVDPHRAPHVVDDLEGVRWDKTGKEIDKRDLKMTHVSDAVGYFCAEEYPVVAQRGSSTVTAVATG